MLIAGPALALLVATTPMASCSPPLRPRIAEVFYDALGDDTGREYVELFNPHAVTLPLAGAKLEVGDGSGPGRWTVRWTGAPGDSIASGARFVIGGALVDATPKATVTLDLQNGPDAVRLVWPDGASEVVGYGALEFAEYFCGAPAVDVPSGQALARLPDDADLGSNALDFRAAAPSPGRANQRRRDAALVAGRLAIEPELPRFGDAARLVATVENRGVDPIATGALSLDVRDASDSTALASTRLAMTLAPAESATVAVDLPSLAEGEHHLVAAIDLSGDEAPQNDVDSLWVRIGLGPLRLTEIQFHPSQAEGEWIEVVNAGGTPLDLAGFALTDRGGHPAHPTTSVLLSPESLAVLAQDRRALLARFAGLDSTRVIEARPWPALNNSDDDSGIADIVRLVGPRTLTDRVPYSSVGIPAGWTLEESAGVWGVGAGAGGSPLAFPRMPAAVARRFEIEPRRLVSGASARLAWDLPWPRARVAFELYDLAGRSRGVVLAETAVAARGERTWIARDVGAGVYLVVMRARPESGDGTLAVARPLRIEAARGRTP
jgi:hypothetical protein